LTTTEATDYLRSALLRAHRSWVPSAVKIHVDAVAVEEAED
jgi:hypothetical protein